MNPRRIGADLLVFARGYIRSPVGLFFSLIFPIILITLFGLIFSTTPGATTLYTQNLDHNSPQSVAFLAALDETGIVKVQLVTLDANESLPSWLAQQGNPVGLIIPSGFGADYAGKTPVNVTVIVDPQDPSSSGNVEAAVNGVVAQANLQASGGTNIVGTTTENVGSQVYKYIDYLVPGLIGFAILTSPMFALVELTSTYRKDGLFKELSLTPLTRGEWLAAKFIWYVLLTFISAALMIITGVLLFHAQLTISWGMIPFLIVGPLFFVSLGMLAGTAAKTPETAAVIGNVITFPMMFLSGTFFPVSGFGPALQAFAHILPLYYVIDGLNQVMLFGNIPRALFDLLIVSIGAVIVFAAAIRFFKWRSD
jgi:ABC-2 type transport system permease protein